MTEPESEAESMDSDDGDDEEEGAEFSVYYPDLMDVKIHWVKVKCKGCGKKFPFAKDEGVKMRDSSLVVNYYEHCLKNCVPYITAGDMKSCIPCRLYFMNQDNFEQHKDDCVKNVKKQQQQPASSGKGKLNPAANRSTAKTRQQQETAKKSRKDQEEENEGEKMAKELLDMNFVKLVDQAKQAMIKRPGPASRTIAASSSTANGNDENSNANKTRAGPSASATAQVLAERKLSGKDLSQLTNALKKRNAVKTPSALARKKEEKKRKREEREKKKRQVSRLSDSSPSSSSESDDDDDDQGHKRKRHGSGDERKKKRRKKKKPFDPEKAKYRTYDTSSSELDPDEEEFPEFVYKLEDVKLKQEDYFNYIPKVSLTRAQFNDSIKCKGCNEPFACYRPQMDPSSHRRKEAEIPAPAFFKHCLRDCKEFQKMKIMKVCEDCCHRFINHDAYLFHRRGGKNSLCNKHKKTLVEPLKYKWHTVARDTYFRALEIGQKKKNSKMCCPGCGNTYKCWKRGFDHIPDLVMMMHCLTDCEEYKKLGLIVKCPTCNCEFMDQKWLDDHECDKAPVATKAKGPPLGGKSIPESSSSSAQSKAPPAASATVASASKVVTANAVSKTNKSPQKSKVVEKNSKKKADESNSSSSSSASSSSSSDSDQE